MAVVEVTPSDLPPVRYKGRVWIRVGPSRRTANQQEERLLVERRTAFQRTFDARPCAGCALDDLVPDLFLVSYLPAAVSRDVIEENQRDVKEQMASLRCYDLGEDCPTLFGRGVIRAQEALRRNGNPAAEFRFEPSHVLVTIRSAP